MNKEQFELAYRKWAANVGTMVFPWDVSHEWNRYERGRSWANEFFSTAEGAKYVG